MIDKIVGMFLEVPLLVKIFEVGIVGSSIIVYLFFLFHHFSTPKEERKTSPIIGLVMVVLSIVTLTVFNYLIINTNPLSQLN